ncbi:hypothetical protein EC968_005942 [Mortierella alpina]|nr:hypothetical protein EC968_005942 [Mortierella alpina]
MVFSSSKVSSKRKPLAPQSELGLVNIYLQQGRISSKKGEREIALVLCEEAEASLSKMKTCMKAAEVQHNADLCRGVAGAFFELSKLLEELKEWDRAKEICSKAHNWGPAEVEKLAIAASPYSVSVANQLSSETMVSTSDQLSRKTTNTTQLPPMTTEPMEVQPLPKTQNSVANKPIPDKSTTTIDLDKSVDGDFFIRDRTPPVTEHKLPKSDERIVSTHQLTYCLGLLKTPPSSDDPYQTSAIQWVKSTRVNQDELERLNTLTTNLVRVFIQDELKGPAAIAEVGCIAPYLDEKVFRCLLELFINSIEKSTLLNIYSLEGLAKLVQGADEGYIEAADLVKILEVEGLDRVTLHECLSGYIDELKASDDPHMVYLAAYAFQALECVPDNESPWQATIRRTGTVMHGIFSIVKAVKGLDVNSFLDGVRSIEAGMDGLAKATQTLQDGYDNVSALIGSGQSLFGALKEGFSFDHKRSWYSALRGIDRVIRDGQLSKFRTLVFDASCRRSLAFQWGVCQRLGDLAANPAWDPESCEEALEFLAEIYQNDADWGYHAHVKQKILDIFLHFRHRSKNAIQTFDSTIAEKMLRRLKHNGDQAKQALYKSCLKQGPSQHPLNISQSPFPTPSLLDRVQNKPDVKEDLRKLKQRRLRNRGDVVYIPPQAKENLKASDDALFDLTKLVKDFLDSSDQKVLLILGDSGSGKSTFNRQIEHYLWQEYEKTKRRIPLFINLPAIDRPDRDMIAKQLRKFEFSDSQIRELKTHCQFVLICDVYDESQETHNLYTTNCLNQTGEWQVQMVVSCRSEYIGLDYQDRFQPTDDNTQFQEAVIAPFSRNQINDYVAKYVVAKTPLWTAKQYTDLLDQIPSLQELVKNPFLLTLSLDVLPRILDPCNNLEATKVSRVTLYDEFVVLWLERGKKRLGNKDMDRQERSDFDRLTDEGFTQNGISFLTDMAKAIYKNQAGNPMVTFSRKQDQGTWKEAFFFRGNESQFLLEASPLTRSGIQYRFIHKSLLEYFFARSVFEPQEGTRKFSQAVAPTRRGSVSSIFSFDDKPEPEEPATTQSPAIDFPLSWRSFVAEPSFLDFLSERVQQEPLFKQQLLAIIEQSKVDKDMRKAAANAITILIRARVLFNGADLKGIQIPGADLSGGKFDSAHLQGADLRKAIVHRICLRRADLRGAKLAGVKSGKSWNLLENNGAQAYSSSSDGQDYDLGLGEYSFPRLFVVFPEELTEYDPGNWFETKFRLHFICECGKHTEANNCKAPHHLHLAKHNGYLIRESTEFFEKYGPFLLSMLGLIKFGKSVAGHVVPTLASLKVLGLVDSVQKTVESVMAKIDYSLECIKSQLAKVQASSPDRVEMAQQKLLSYLNDGEGAGGVDLPHLGSFLEASKGKNIFGDLYRLTTSDGHVKWVCCDHYQAIYPERHAHTLDNVVSLEQGKFDEYLGKITITLRSRFVAAEFYGVVSAAKGIVEIIVELGWECYRRDLEELHDWIKESRVSIVWLALRQFRTSKLLSTSSQFGPLFRLSELPHMKRVHIVLPRNLANIPSSESRELSSFCKLSFEMAPESIDGENFGKLAEMLKTNATVATLNLRDNTIGDNGTQALAAALATNSTVTSLDLQANFITDFGAQALSKALEGNSTLTTMNLQANFVGDNGAWVLSEALKTNSALRKWNLRDNSIGDNGAQALSEVLKTNSALTTLGLRDNFIGDNGAQALAEALKTNSTLTTLGLRDNFISEIGAQALSKALKINKTMATLDLGYNNIGLNGAQALSEALKTNSTLTTLDLQSNSVGDNGAKALAESLKTNSTLTTLSLNSNDIEPSGAQALSEALMTNSTLATLDLQSNSIGDSGVKALAEALKINSTLATLDLQSNSIGDSGAQALSEALRTNSTLTILDLQSNSVGDNGAKALAEALKTNSTLATLDLQSNSVGDNGAKALAEALKVNSTLTTLNLKSNDIESNALRGWLSHSRPTRQ